MSAPSVPVPPVEPPSDDPFRYGWRFVRQTLPDGGTTLEQVRTLLDKKLTRWIFDTLLARGVIAMIYNPEVRINPPLVITDEQAMEALATLKAVLEEASARVRQ